MNRQLADKLEKDFPYTFKRVGFECGDGWEPILRRAAEKLEPLILKHIEETGDKENAPCASQIKEKYGTLRFYLSTGTDEMYAITEAAEKASEKTCEKCGQPGKIKGKYWVYTACNEHTKVEDRVKDFNDDMRRILKN